MNWHMAAGSMASEKLEHKTKNLEPLEQTWHST